jgi:hypothetical protein
MHVCPSYAKGERWLFVSGTGDIFVVEENNADFESPIEGGRGYIWGAKSIGNTSCFFVGPHRKVFQRTQRNMTFNLHTAKLGTKNLIEESGFRDIDGFASNDLYACGGLGDLWRYDGTEWHFIDLTTNIPLQLVSCGSNGKAHILAGGRFLYVGRESEWAEVRFDDFDDLVGDIQWYKDRLIIVTETSCYELIDNQAVPSQLIAKSPLKDYAYIDTYDKYIFLVNGFEGAFFDGNTWTKVL